MKLENGMCAKHPRERSVASLIKTRQGQCRACVGKMAREEFKKHACWDHWREPAVACLLDGSQRQICQICVDRLERMKNGQEPEIRDSRIESSCPQTSVLIYASRVVKTGRVMALPAE